MPTIGIPVGQCGASIKLLKAICCVPQQVHYHPKTQWQLELFQFINQDRNVFLCGKPAGPG
jgi:hypothetical protein